MSTIPDTPNPAIEPANKFTPDAQKRMSHLRAIADEFPDEENPKPLTLAEIRLARGTPVATLENAAIFLEAAPALGNAIGPSTEVVDLREAIAFELAYAGVRDEARALVRRIDMAILRRKLKASKAARGVYRVAKGFVTVDAGDHVRPHVNEIKRSLSKRGRRKTAATPAAQIPVKQ